MKWLALVLVFASALGPGAALAQAPNRVPDADGDFDGSDAGDLPDMNTGAAASVNTAAPGPSASANVNVSNTPSAGAGAGAGAAGVSAGASASAGTGGGAPNVATTTTTGGGASNVSGTVAHTPEPLTLALTALGLVGAAALRRRRS